MLPITHGVSFSTNLSHKMQIVALISIFLIIDCYSRSELPEFVFVLESGKVLGSGNKIGSG